MMVSTYAMAYTEVLEILKYIPKEEYNKIPKEKIEFYEKNKDNNYSYTFDISKPIKEQKISRKANSVITSLYMEYFATPIQKEKLELILKYNEEKYQEELRKKYNPDNLFKNRVKDKNKNLEESEIQKVNIVEYKESIFVKFKKWFKNIFFNK